MTAFFVWMNTITLQRISVRWVLNRLPSFEPFNQAVNEHLIQLLPELIKLKTINTI
jgi:hypothetical protein